MTTTPTSPLRAALISSIAYDGQRFEMRHLPHCEEPRLSHTFTGSTVEILCRTCDAARFLFRSQKALSHRKRAQLATSRYRCGLHPEEPVTWRGTGCVTCHDQKGNR